LIIKNVAGKTENVPALVVVAEKLVLVVLKRVLLVHYQEKTKLLLIQKSVLGAVHV